MQLKWSQNIRKHSDSLFQSWLFDPMSAADLIKLWTAKDSNVNS